MTLDTVKNLAEEARDLNLSTWARCTSYVKRSRSQCT